MQLRSGPRGGDHAVAEPEQGIDWLAAAAQAVQYAAAADVPDEDKPKCVACMWQPSVTDAAHCFVSHLTPLCL